MSETALYEFNEKKECIKAATTFIKELIAKTLKAQSQFSLALSGGTTPKRLYEKLASIKEISWNKVHLFLVDERFVLKDHPHSNMGMINEALLSKIEILKSNIHRVKTELKSIEEVSVEYQRELKEYFGEANMPSFDLAILGLGVDGHTASIFPNSKAVGESGLVAIEPSPKLPPMNPRITLTLGVLNSAKCVMFFVMGNDKKNIVSEVVKHRKTNIDKYPAAKIAPKKELVWFVQYDN